MTSQEQEQAIQEEIAAELAEYEESGITITPELRAQVERDVRSEATSDD